MPLILIKGTQCFGSMLIWHNVEQPIGMTLRPVHCLWRVNSFIILICTKQLLGYLTMRLATLC